MNERSPPPADEQRKRYHVLRRLEAAMDVPMLLLALAWLWLFIVELTRGLTPVEARLGSIIWVIFVAEFVVRLVLAPRKFPWLRRNLLTLLALVLPALRLFRALRIARVLQSTRFLSGGRAVRAVTSGNRLLVALRRAQGPQPEPEMNVGIMLALTQRADQRAMQDLASSISKDMKVELEYATGIPWHFHESEPAMLDSDAPRRPSAFLDDATLRMAEGPFDILLVVTDAPLSSRRMNLHAGLASATCRVAVLSTRKLVVNPRDSKNRSVDDAAVHGNATALGLHLFGHMLGLEHDEHSEVMKRWQFDEERRATPRVSARERQWLRDSAPRLPEHELEGGNILETVVFHLLMAGRHPARVLRPMLHSRAPLLPLALPGLATAAVAPALLLVFTAEIWDVALNMSNFAAGVFSALTVFGAAIYLTQVQNLMLPRREKRILTEHLAVANVSIFLSILLACAGLLMLVGGLILVIAVFIFPPDLMYTWSTLDKEAVVWADKLRLSCFIGGIGVATGALAGGLESRTLIQHLALFRDCE